MSHICGLPSWAIGTKPLEAQTREATKQLGPEWQVKTMARQSGKIPAKVIGKDFIPCPHSVILGRGKTKMHSPGNFRLKKIVAEHAERYAKSSRECKSEILVGSHAPEFKGEVATIAFN